ncbi:MAG: aminoacyl-tRNA hydrolase [Bacteroidales bacterium]|nr:aminoacyl-tRNA hydrolase [Bacteroidales bacterium]
MADLQGRQFENEFEITAVRSSGPGGQHVNKTSTKIELRFDVDNSELLTDEEKNLLRNNLANMISRNGYLIITSQESRSQSSNRENAIKKFYQLLKQGLNKPKKRKKTNPPTEAKEKRLEEKKKHSQKKDWRKPPEL